MAPYRVHFAHDVEQERIDVVVQCLTSCDSKHSETRECEGRGCGAETGAPYLVVQEQLGQKAQVLHQPATIFSKQHQLASCDHSPGSTFYSCCRPPQTLRCCPCGRSRPRGGAAPCFAPAGAQRRSGRGNAQRVGTATACLRTICRSRPFSVRKNFSVNSQK